MKPMVSRIRINEAQMMVRVGLENWMAHGVGRRRAISRSNRRKRIATRKNRIEYGRRAEPNGSKPHSYGDSFSVSGLINGSQKLTVARMRTMRAVMETKISIIFSWVQTKIK